MIEVPLQNYALPTSEADRLLSYPYTKPEGSFLSDGETVSVVADTYAEFRTITDEYLSARSLPLLAERVPVVAYGANSNPVRMSEKMAAYGGAELRPALQTVPNLIATIPDTAVVWHGKPGQTGSTFAELYRGDETQGEGSAVHLSFLTPLQLSLLHATEGVTYHLTWLDALAGSDAMPIKAVAYTAGRSEILLRDGEPVRVKRVGDYSPGSAMTAEEAVNYMLSAAGGTAGVQTARELVASTQRLKLSEKKMRQTAISARLGELGMNKMFSFPTETYIGRADFNSISRMPDVLHIMEESLEPLRPGLEEVLALARNIGEKQGLDQAIALQRARKQLDIAEVIRQRARDELAERLTA